jgi:cell division septal protein FtsQ
MAMKMRQSLAQFEREFLHETQRDRRHRRDLQRDVVVRSRKRSWERNRKRGSIRFRVLALSLVATAVLVTVAMFASLYYLLS